MPAFDAEALEVDLWPWDDLELRVLEAVGLFPLETSDPPKVFKTFKATQLHSNQIRVTNTEFQNGFQLRIDFWMAI